MIDKLSDILTATLYKYKKFDVLKQIFLSLKPTKQDELIKTALTDDQPDFVNELIFLISVKQDPTRAGQLASAALVAGHYLVAHQLLHLQRFALFKTQVPPQFPAAPYAIDVLSEKQAKGLKSTQLLWEVWSEQGSVLAGHKIPAEIIARIAQYLQPPHRKGLRENQKQSLLFFGYKDPVKTPASTQPTPLSIL